MVSRGKPFRKGGSGGPAAPPAGAGGGCGVDVVLLGPRTPLWACSCGEVSNWASRCACRRCGSWAPISTRDKAKAADAAARRTFAANGGSQPQASPAAARFKEVQDELQEAKRRIKELEAKSNKQPAAAAGGGPSSSKEEGAETDEQLDKDIRKHEEELRILQASTRAGHLIKVIQGELDEMRRRRRSGKPVGAQLRDAQAILDRKKKALEQVRTKQIPEKLESLRKATEELEKCKAKEGELVEAVKAAELEVQRVAGLSTEHGGSGTAKDELFDRLLASLKAAGNELNPEVANVFTEYLEATAKATEPPPQTGSTAEAAGGTVGGQGTEVEVDGTKGEEQDLVMEDGGAEVPKVAAPAAAAAAASSEETWTASQVAEVLSKVGYPGTVGSARALLLNKRRTTRET